MARKINSERLLERLGIRFEVRGSQLWASCPHPEHNDSSPSWRMVNDMRDQRHGQHRCYGCGRGGWPIHLVEWVLGCGRQAAREWLRDIEASSPPLPLGVEVERLSYGKKFRLPHGVVFDPLEEWPSKPKDYLTKERQVNEWQANRWSLCYAPDGWHPVRNPLAGRIVFPVKDLDGNLLSYTGRSYVGSKRRYKEPSKDEGADLGAVFGEQFWGLDADRDLVVVTEGALDALAIERVSSKPVNLAGVFGSQLHQGHLARLSSFKKVLVASDPDQAGNKVLKELEAQLKRWTVVRRVQLPPGEDCASLKPAELSLALNRAFEEVRSGRP